MELRQFEYNQWSIYLKAHIDVLRSKITKIKFSNNNLYRPNIISKIVDEELELLFSNNSEII